MGYDLNAILGDLKQLRAAASSTPPAVVVSLTDQIGLIPLSEEFLEAINQGGTESYEDIEPKKFAYLSVRVASWIKSLSATALLAYVEAEYWGGTGDQCAVAWRGGSEVLPPMKGQGAINQALRLLGVQAASGKDEFDTVWLGRHRTMADWVDEGTARQRTAVGPQNPFAYPPFHEATESLRRFLRDQGCSDTIRWIWREDICTRRDPGSRRSCKRSVYVRLAGCCETPVVERYYQHGVARNLGIALELFCLAAGHACCFVYVPEDETDASYRMVAGLKLSVPTEPIVAKGVANPWLWAAIRLLLGTPDHLWMKIVPKQTDAIEAIAGMARTFAHGVP